MPHVAIGTHAPERQVPAAAPASATTHAAPSGRSRASWLPKHTESIGLKTRYLHSRRGHSVASVTESSCEPSSRWKKNDGHGALGGATHAPSMQNEAPPSPQPAVLA